MTERMIGGRIQCSRVRARSRTGWGSVGQIEARGVMTGATVIFGLMPFYEPSRDISFFY